MPFQMGVILSLMYTAVVASGPLVLSGGSHLREWGHWGDWFAGAALPLAIAWAIAGFYKQSEELRLQAGELRDQKKQLADQLDEMKETRTVMQGQLDEMKETRTVMQGQLAIQMKLAEEAAKQNKYNEFIEMQQYVAKFEAHLEDLARYFVTKDKFGERGFDFSGTEEEDRPPYYYITELKRRLASHHNMHGTPEVQAKIAVVDEDSNYIQFRHEFSEFLKRVGTYDWLLSKHVIALRLHLCRFQGYSRIRSRSVGPQP